MASILQLTREIRQRPITAAVPGVEMRHYAGPADIEVWLDLRRRAFARQKLGVGDWQKSDFEREFLAKTWWRPQAMWFAETRPLAMPPAAIATVTLALRGAGPDARPVVHWLAVLPAYRRRGIARLLVSTLETAVWDAGGRQVWLETHSAWSEAARLYESLGYRPADV